jgi:hypothetical protein
MPSTGWTRVSRGSHAGHVPWRVRLRYESVRDHGRATRAVPERPLYPGVGMRERTTTAAGLRLVPLETLDRAGYRRLDPRVSPPWEKRLYHDPLAPGTA